MASRRPAESSYYPAPGPNLEHNDAATRTLITHLCDSGHGVTGRVSLMIWPSTLRLHG
jgi:hypothetical protein